MSSLAMAPGLDYSPGLLVVPRSNDNHSNDIGVERSLLSAGSIFNVRYQVVRCIGAGGMGAVYEVLHLATQRRRVLKTVLPSLLSDADVRDRFRLEATITAGIESEHIVEVFDAGFDEDTGLPFLVMEYLRGESLAEILRERGRLPPEDVTTLLSQVSRALERTHAAGIVHRDLKPENLFLTRRDDGSPHLKILDFGIAKVIAQSTTLRTTRNLGTPLYMAPEQLRGDGDIDERADLYALGQIAFTLLVGTPYWKTDASSREGVYPLLLKIAEGAKESATTRAIRYGYVLPTGFDAWFARATATSVLHRFESVTELVEELAAVLDGRISPFAPAKLPQLPTSDCLTLSLPATNRRRQPWLFGTAALSGLVLFAGGAVLLQRGTKTTNQPGAPRLAESSVSRGTASTTAATPSASAAMAVVEPSSGVAIAVEAPKEPLQRLPRLGKNRSAPQPVRVPPPTYAAPTATLANPVSTTSIGSDPSDLR